MRCFTSATSALLLGSLCALPLLAFTPEIGFHVEKSGSVLYNVTSPALHIVLSGLKLPDIAAIVLPYRP